MKEIEVKILNIDKDKIVKQLIALGGIKTFDGQIKARFYSNEQGKRLRLRQMKTLHPKSFSYVLNYKDRGNAEGMMVNEEHEVAVSDYIGMVAILESIGFKQYKTSEKTRISYKIDDIVFDIDTYDGIPSLLEVESSSQTSVKRGVSLLGYSMKDTVIISEQQLKNQYGLK